jgi:hypothetical protein
MSQAGAEEVKAGPWRPLFDGQTLNGWTPKVAKHPAGENYRQTFVVDHGAIRVSYAGYDKLDGQFGHLFYKTPFKAYRLRLTRIASSPRAAWPTRPPGRAATAGSCSTARARRA